MFTATGAVNPAGLRQEAAQPGEGRLAAPKKFGRGSPHPTCPPTPSRQPGSRQAVHLCMFGHPARLHVVSRAWGTLAPSWWLATVVASATTAAHPPNLSTHHHRRRVAPCPSPLPCPPPSPALAPLGPPAPPTLPAGGPAATGKPVVDRHFVRPGVSLLSAKDVSWLRAAPAPPSLPTPDAPLAVPRSAVLFRPHPFCMAGRAGCGEGGAGALAP